MIGIYKITNQTNGKAYFGSSINIEQRWRNHKSDLNIGRHGNSKLQAAWNKYGPEVFSFQVILCCDECNLFEFEQKILDKAFEVYTKKNLYNVAKDAFCPTRGRIVSEETKKKISENRKGTSAWNKGKPWSKETKEKMRLAKLGKKQSEESKAKKSNALKGNTNAKGHTPWNKGISGYYGINKWRNEKLTI